MNRCGSLKTVGHHLLEIQIISLLFLVNVDMSKLHKEECFLRICGRWEFLTVCIENHWFVFFVLNIQNTKLVTWLFLLYPQFLLKLLYSFFLFTPPWSLFTFKQLWGKTWSHSYILAHTESTLCTMHNLPAVEISYWSVQLAYISCEILHFPPW